LRHIVDAHINALIVTLPQRKRFIRMQEKFTLD